MNFNYGFCLLTVFCWKVQLQQLELTGSDFVIELSIQDDYVSYEMTNVQPVCGLSMRVFMAVSSATRHMLYYSLSMDGFQAWYYNHIIIFFSEFLTI